MDSVGLFYGLMCSLIFLPKQVRCKEERITKMKYFNKYKLTDMFLKVEYRKMQPLLDATAKIAKEYVNKILKTDNDKLTVEKTITYLDKIGKRLKQFLKQLPELETMRIHLLNIMLQNISKVVLEVADESFKTIHKAFTMNINRNLQFLSFGIGRVGLTYMNDDFVKSLKIMKDYRKKFNKLFKTIPGLKEMKEVKRLQQKLKQFYMGTKKLQKSSNWIVKTILQLKIPDGIASIGSKNCNAESKGVNLIRTDDGASFLAVCDSEWLVVAQRFDGSVNFTRHYEDYSIGFGDPPSEYFIGLDNFVSAASQDMYMLRFELTTWENETRTADYLRFDVTPLDYADPEMYKPSWYSLRVLNFHGTAGNSLYFQDQYDEYAHFNPFSKTGECFEEQEKGWWWGYCGKANLFGRYNHGPECDKAMACMSWQAWPDKL
ncbi:unnamed protein product, partial [Owenia fusiformis]